MKPQQDQQELFELLIVCASLVHAWRLGDEDKVDAWIHDISKILRQRDDRLREKRVA